MSVRPPIAVVGVSALFPGSADAQHFWRNIVEGADLLSDVPESHWRISDYYDPEPDTPDKMYAQRGGFLPYVDFVPTDFGVPPNTVPAIDTAQLLALAVARQVLEDVAGGDFSHVDTDRVSVVLGVASATEMVAHMSGRLQAPVWERALRGAGITDEQLELFMQRIAAAYTPWQADTFPGLLGNVVAGRIANRFDLGGTNCVVDAACASSLAALQIALNELYLGDSEMVITGGVDALNDILMFMCFAKVTALSPSGDCRPFSDQADGTMLGEGLAMVALKRLEDAERDGDPIYAVIRGLGASSDGRAKSIYAPSSSGQAQALRRAYDAAGYGPETVGLLEAHGTATKAGDIAEFTALRDVFDDSGRQDRQWCAIGSVKSQVGHTKAAAGACGLFKAVMALHHKTLPPTIKVDQPNPALDIGASPFYLSTQSKPWISGEGVPRRASVSSFGFGGTNFHVALEEYTGSGHRPRRHRSWKSELVVLGAATPTSLADEAARLSASLRDDNDMLCYLAQATQTRYDAAQQSRLALVADDVASLRSMLDEAADRLANGTDVAPFASPRGYFFSGQPTAPVALLFPGQGSQYVGMGADIPRLFNAALSPWETARASLFDSDRDLHQIVWPRTAFTEKERAEQAVTLTRTEWAQPAIGAHSLSLLQIIRALGIKPVAVAGHSFGEVVALCAAGVFDDNAALEIARKRGALMAQAARTGEGTMCAVSAPSEIVRELLAHWRLPVVIANHNSPNQVILSGPVASVLDVVRRLSEVGIQATELNVATAFHSDIVAGAAVPFAKFLSEIPFEAPTVPVYANATARPYDSDAGAIPAALAEQLAQPVHFSEMVRSMWAAGARTFVEVGPDGVLTNLVSKCLAGLPHHAVALDRKHTNGIRALWLGLAQLVAAGVPMDFANLWADYHMCDDPRTRPRSRLVLKINGANYAKPQPDDRPATVSADVANGAAQRQVRPASPVPGLGSVVPTEPPRTNGNGEHNGALLAPVPPTLAPAPMKAVVGVPGVGAGPDLVADMLQVVADKTGYPVEMLDLSMSLEADLGIDSIKRVEILSAVQQKVPSLPEVEAAAMAGLSTLQEIVDYLTTLLPTAPPATNGNGPHGVGSLHERGDRLPFDLAGGPVARHSVRAIAAAAQGMGVPGLHEAERVEIVGGEAVAEALQTILHSHGIRAVAVHEASHDATCVLQLSGLASTGTREEALAVNRRVFADACRIAACMERNGGVFVTVQDTGGTFGLLTDAGSRAWAGGPAALTKTAALEWPNTATKAIDIDTTDRSPRQVAELVAAEITAGGPELEVGLGSVHGRVTVMTYQSRVAGRSARLDQRDVILVSGGARGVTAASVIALARETQATFILIGRSAPGVEPTAAHGLTATAELKRALLTQAQHRGEKLTPRQLEQRVQRVEADREIRATIAAIEQAGARVSYHPLDVRDAAELGTLLDRVRADFGPITAVVHGAGVVADARLSHKTMDQFDRVFGTKVGGLSALLDVTATDPVKMLLLFSSAAARGGNVGQADYVMANEVANQVALSERARRGPGCVVRALGWGPWAAGMVTPALKEVFESRGIKPIPLDDGARAFVSEALDSDTSDGYVVLGDGVASGGLPHPLPETGRSARVVVRAALQPYLHDHRIQQQVVLPMVQVGEWFVGAAQACRPGQHVQRLLDLRVLRGVPLGGFEDAGDVFTVRCVPVPGSAHRLQLLLLDAAGAVRYSATGEMSSGTRVLLPPATELRNGETPLLEPCYGDGALFHGPAFQVLEKLAWCKPAGAVAHLHGLNQAKWPKRRWATDPAALDGCLQVGTLWSFEQTGRRMLPMCIAQVALYRSGPADGNLHCYLDNGEANSSGSVFDLQLADGHGSVIAELRGVEMYPYGS